MALGEKAAASAEWAVKMSGCKEEMQLYSLSAVTWASKAGKCVMQQELTMFYGIYGATTCLVLAWYTPGHLVC